MSRVIVLHAPTPGHASAEWEQRLLRRLPRMDGTEYPIDLCPGVVACLAAVTPPHAIDVQRLEDVAA